MKTVKFTMVALLISFFALQNTWGQTHSVTDGALPMKTFLIEREIPNATEIPQKDLKGLSQKSCDVLKNIGPGIKWVKSYIVDDKFYCLYEASSKDKIEMHAKEGGFPITKIMEVTGEIGPETARD